MFTRDEFLEKMHVAEIDRFLFQGEPLEMGLPRVFGGQVLGQALNAAFRTIDPERRPHSLHGYFLRPGDMSRSIIYEVDPIRDGRSFSTRRVVAKQRGEAIFNASLSFQIYEDGLAHQMDMPSDIPNFKELADDIVYLEEKNPNVLQRYSRTNLVFDPSIVEFRTPNLMKTLEVDGIASRYGYWFKFHDGIGDDPIIQRTILAFISDKGLMSTALRAHPVSFETHKIIGASLDHSMWFHADIKLNQWIYYHIDSPRSARARGLNRGSFYNQDGVLIASTAQEGLMRVVGERD